tara:strand:+ start:7834 stop:8130 length:297 start_codon:yes stop_codon:yes gene_type:complete
MNKFERNAIEVTLDYFIDTMIDIRSYFEKPIEFETIVGLGDWTLKLIKEHLEGDIENTYEVIIDNWDNEEGKKHWEKILNDQRGALIVINKAIKHKSK